MAVAARNTQPFVVMARRAVGWRSHFERSMLRPGAVALQARDAVVRPMREWPARSLLLTIARGDR
jgi:hypothetical protein